MNIKKIIKDFEITACIVRDKNSIAFICQNWEVDDPLVPHETVILTCDINNPKNVIWNKYEIGTTTGLNGCMSYKPDLSWIFITDLSDVFVIGENGGQWEERIVKDSRLFTLKAKCIDASFAYALGPNTIHSRNAINSWSKLNEGLNTKEVSFDDIDGFSESDIYACGGYSDLWRYDGELWSQIQLPQNLRVKYLCCGNDGYVYIVSAARNSILKGRGDVWEFIEKTDSKKTPLGKIVWFGDKLKLLTTQKIYEVSSTGGFELFDMSNCHIKKSFSQMAVGDGIFVVTSSNEAAVYDGGKWTVII